MFIGGREFPASFATSPRFYSGILNVFRHVTPLLRFLNEPLLGKTVVSSERNPAGGRGRPAVRTVTTDTTDMAASSAVPAPVNEPVRSYAPGSPERASLKARLAQMAGERIEIPLVIGGQDVRDGDTAQAVMPHDSPPRPRRLPQGHARTGRAAPSMPRSTRTRSGRAGRSRIARPCFSRPPSCSTTTWRDTLNGATMLGQSKTVFQAEIDSACEIIDFWRFNVHFAQEILSEQPMSDHTMWNRLEYRALEGFVYAVTPFNFTSIAANLPTAPALMGNTVVWKPASSAMFSAHFLMQLLEEAGLPPGVINFVAGDAAMISNVVLSHRELAGVHFTGSTEVFNSIWKTIGGSAATYRSYPRIVGETGGKDFVVAHPSADPAALAVAIVRGGYEFQGQKCSAVSRVYIPRSLWNDVRDRMVAMIDEIKVGDIRDFRNFMGAVIDERAFKKISAYIDDARTTRDDRRRRHVRRRHGLLRAADARRNQRPGPPAAVRGDLRPGRHGVRLRRRKVARDAGDWSIRRRRTR